MKGLPIAGDACGKSLFPVKLGDGEVVALACSPGSLQCWKRLLSIVRTAQEILGEHGSGEIVAWSTTNPPPSSATPPPHKGFVPVVGQGPPARRRVRGKSLPGKRRSVVQGSDGGSG